MAAIRWAICVSERGLLKIQLHALPAAVTTLSAKPIFKSDNIPVMLLKSWPGVAVASSGCDLLKIFHQLWGL